MCIIMVFSFVFLMVFCAWCVVTSSPSCVGDQLLGLVLFVVILYNVGKRYSHYVFLFCIVMVVGFNLDLIFLVFFFLVVHHHGGFFPSSPNVLLCKCMV